MQIYNCLYIINYINIDKNYEDVMIPITSETVMCSRHPKKELDIYCRYLIILLYYILL
jgi:hypothetical protein